MKPITIILVDDHEAIREGYVGVLNEQPDMAVVASLDDPQQIEETIARTRASVLVLDISMRNFNAVRAVRGLKAAFPALKVLIASMHDEPIFVIDLLDAGVDGYYLKSERLKLLPEAIREVNSGRGWYSRSVGTTVARLHGSRKPNNDLTDREITVLIGCASGASTVELAKELYISPRTAQTHLTHIFKKLGARNRTEALSIAIKRGIISPSNIGKDQLP